MKPDAFSGFDRIWRRMKHLQMAIEHRSRRKNTGYSQNHSTLDVLDVNSLQVERSTLPRAGFDGGLPMHLDPAHARRSLGRKNLDFVLLLNSPRDQRASDDGSESFHREA